ncbi:AAA family ATPase [Halothiobacillus sp.]|uniref:AAA family ATPase n=1 Tax=Halothiobacillus sp. TaxID=1891311 RepID=UPI002AD50126|nr:AAA family ATPase [Halothiobacillus sp.]
MASTRSTKSPELLRQARERHNLSGLDDNQWDEFLLIYKGGVDDSLAGYVAWADKHIAELNGKPLQPGDPNTTFIADDVDIGTLSLSTIAAEMTRLEALFSADKVVRDQYAALTKRIGQENANLKASEAKLTDAQSAADRKKGLQSERDEAYRRIFDAIINEQAALAELYAPLMVRLAASSGTLRKLGFYVRRIVDTSQWSAFAEENLLDLRKAGPFNGRGSLTYLAEQWLKPAWENGTAVEIQEAMINFISTYLGDILAHAPYAPKQQAEYKAWLKQFAHWLFGTDHISVRYEIVYDRTDIRKLSPGTRGIVLLLLYLALDEADDRPLIIDQPEENLDPKSVNDELVPLFIAAKAKRQVIMVTHNANLVINTNADQVIIAEVGPHLEGELPPITYRAGGLENASIRKVVCDILEGGESAFQERARRLRVRLER